MEIMQRTRNIRPNEVEMNKLWGKIESWVKAMDVIEELEYDDSVFNIYKKMGLFSYESSYFDRLLLGWTLSTYGPDKKVVVSAKDSEVQKLLMREKVWRDEIGQGVDYVQLVKLIKTAGCQVDGKIKVGRKDLVSEAIMVGWNAQQVHEMLIEMAKFGMVQLKSSEVIMEGDDEL
jgi:hypothetical protein